MKNLIKVNFKQKRIMQRTNPLTRLELLKINARITEINKIFDICEEDDIIENLTLELENLIETIEDSLQLAIEKEKAV